MNKIFPKPILKLILSFATLKNMLLWKTVIKDFADYIPRLNDKYRENVFKFIQSEGIEYYEFYLIDNKTFLKLNDTFIHLNVNDPNIKYL